MPRRPVVERREHDARRDGPQRAVREGVQDVVRPQAHGAGVRRQQPAEQRVEAAAQAAEPERRGAALDKEEDAEVRREQPERVERTCACGRF